jgi:hypothetical protein
MTSIALPKSAVNFEWGREVPHILYTKVAPTARRILVIGENRLLQHGVIAGQSHTEALGISSPGIDEAQLLGLAITGELQWSIMSDWTYP